MKIQISEHPPSANRLFLNAKSTANHFGLRAAAGKANTRRSRVQTPEYRAWITRAGYDVLLSRAKPVEGKVRLTLRYEDKGKADLDNLIKPVLDLLVTHQIIVDDKRPIVREVRALWDAEIKGVLVEIHPAP